MEIRYVLLSLWYVNRYSYHKRLNHLSSFTNLEHTHVFQGSDFLDNIRYVFNDSHWYIKKEIKQIICGIVARSPLFSPTLCHKVLSNLQLIKRCTSSISLSLSYTRPNQSRGTRDSVRKNRYVNYLVLRIMVIASLLGLW